MSAKMTEQDREDAARSVPCQVCKAKPNDKCTMGDLSRHTNGMRSHTARYLLAASRGLVPLLPGGGT